MKWNRILIGSLVLLAGCSFAETETTDMVGTTHHVWSLTGKEQPYESYRPARGNGKCEKAEDPTNGS